MSDAQTIYVVDDDPTVLQTVTMVLAREGFAAKGYCSAAEFLKDYSPRNAGCLLLDVHMPEVSGLDLQQHLAKIGAQLPIVIVTGAGDVGIAVEAMKWGAVDFIEKPFTATKLIETVQRALLLDVRVNAERLKALRAANHLAVLTDRERTILDLAMTGRSTKEIAQLLGISPRTVDAHRASILKKLNVDSIAELVRSVLMLRSPP